MNTVIEKITKFEKIYSDIEKNDDGRIKNSTEELLNSFTSILHVINYENEELFKTVKQKYVNILHINLDDSFETGFCKGILLGVNATNIIEDDCATDVFSSSVISELFSGKNYAESLKQSAIAKIDKIFYEIQSRLDEDALPRIQKAKEAAISHHDAVAEIYFKKGLQTGLVLGVYAKIHN